MPTAVYVVGLAAEELENLWTDQRYRPPTDEDTFVRAQKVVIAYATFYASNVVRATYTRDFAYRRAREVARPIAALAAGIALTDEQLSEFAFIVYDAIASWADPQDAGVRAIGAIFQAYAFPGDDYDNVKVPREKRR